MLRNSKKEELSSLSMLTVIEVADLLHVHPNTIRLWSKIGTLKAYRIGKRRDYRFRIADVETFLYKDGSPPT
jgi:excisionase family DNA binding protein